jgi:hypothetical protein
MKTHYKRLRDSNYFGAHTILDGEHTELTVTIKMVAPGQVKNERGGTDEVTLLHLVDQKPLILNATNGDAISKLLDTPFIEDWGGHRITLYVKQEKIKGNWIDVVRVRPKPPKDERETMTVKHKGYKAALEGIKAGTYTIEQIEQKYKLDDETRKNFQDQSKRGK